MANYPDGAAKDPKAPWNQKDVTEWQGLGSSHKGSCICCNEVAELDFEDTCEECFIPSEMSEDEDSDYDRWKDDLLCDK